VVVYGLANLDHLLSREGLYSEEEAVKDQKTNLSKKAVQDK
jgi:hypothetical protein